VGATFAVPDPVPLQPEESYKRLTGFDCADFGSGQTVVSLLNQGDCQMKNLNTKTDQVDV
jgi:hypothetical protein